MADHRHPFIELTITRFREFLREPEALFWVFAFPVLLACALGIAFGTQQTPAVLAGVLDVPGAAALTSTLEGGDGMEVQVLAREPATRALRNGAIHVLVVPGTPITYELDATRPESRVARYVVDERLQQAAGQRQVVPTVDQRIVVPGSRYIDWVVPGLLGMNIMGTGLWSIGFSVVQARVRKLLKRLMATPMRRAQYLASHIAARLVFLVLEAAALLGFAVWVFDVPVQGSWLALSGFCILGAACFAGIGLLVASRATSIETVSGLMNFVMVPMWVLSGVFFASENFPAAMQPAIDLLPLTALNQALRGVMLEGAGPLTLWPQTLVLVAWTVVSFVVALRLFRWR